MENTHELAELIKRHAPQDGSFDMPLPGVGLIRSSALTTPVHTLYEPSFCLVAQGRKKATVGETTFYYDRANFLVVGIDLPIIGAVVEATENEPYLCFRLQLNRSVLSELVTSQQPDTRQTAGVGTSLATPELIDATIRLMRLADAPSEAQALAPLIEREILYRLLIGPQGAILRQIASGESRLNQISRAVSYIRKSYAKAFTVEELASLSGMSPSTFHEHFRTLTTMTPLQFRNHIRLQEARRLMVMEDMTAAEAGFQVGYDSPSQFNRDYTRIYQAPPRRDVERLRAN
jgi:AraC-like DNA-binding protein